MARRVPSKVELFCLALSVLALDQWSKVWIERNLERFATIEAVPGFFTITHVRNTGIAFGLFPSHGDRFGTVLLATLGLGALGVVGYYFLRAAGNQLLLLTALALVLGGAVGNLVDRIALGAVTDFFDFYVGAKHWPTFNVADSAISIGIAILALETLLPFRGRAPVEDAAAPGAASELAGGSRLTAADGSRLAPADDRG